MIFSLALIFIVALIFAGILKHLKLPSLIGMLLTGIILGPSVLNLISNDLLAASATLRQIALIIILLRAGLSLDLKSLKIVGKNAILLSIIPAIFEIIIISIIAMLIFKFDLVNAILLGSVISAASPAVIVPRMLGLIEKKLGTNKQIPQMIMASASVEDVIVIVIFTAALGAAVHGVVSPSLLVILPLKIILGIVFGIIIGFSTSFVFKKFSIINSAKVIVLLSISFMVITLENKLHGVIEFSGLLTIMTIGLVILETNREVAKQISLSFKELWVAAEIILFVLVGASVDISFLLNELPAAILIIFIGLIFRMLGVFLSTRNSNFEIKERKFMMLAYIPKATVQAAIGAIALSEGLASGKIILSVAVVAILITAPLGAILIDKFSSKFLTKEKA